MTTIVMLSGYKRSGKDTAAEFLTKHYGFERHSFAEALKDLVKSKYNITDFDLDQGKEKPLMGMPVAATDNLAEFLKYDLQKELKTVDGKLFWTPRALCILEGNVGRAVNPNYWVDRVARKLKRSDVYVISDFRFKNEYARMVEWFGEKNVITVRIARYDTVDTNHASERELDDFKFQHTIQNTSDLETFYKNLDFLTQTKILGE